MKYSFTLLICAWTLLLCGRLCGDTIWDTVTFREDFNTGVGADNRPDPSVWIVNHPESWWWVQGRTFFPSPTYHPSGPFPRVESGVCAIEHHLYNPYDLSTTPWTFLGGEIHTVRQFDPSSAYRFEARARSQTYPNGLVSSFFTYGFDGAKSDEIDFEFVSKLTNDNTTYPDGNPVLTNPWNESIQKPQYIAPDGLNLNEWNTFRIYWYSGQRIDWTWLDPDNGEILLRSETNISSIPDEPMNLYFNFWAPDDGWLDAFDAGLQPVDNLSLNQIYTYEIDYVEGRIPEPLTIALLATGAVLFLIRPKSKAPRPHHFL